MGTTDQEPASSSSTSRQKDYTSYIYEEAGAREELGQGAHIVTKQALGANVEDASTLKTLGSTTGTGATVGGALGSVVPGIGNAVGGVIGGAAGLVTGGIKTIFGGGDAPEAKFRGVLPILLKQALAKKGAKATHKWPDTDFKYGAKGGVKVKGKAFKPANMLSLTKELARLATKGAESQKMGPTEKYLGYIDVTNRKPSNENRIIASFQRPRPVSEVTANSTSTKNGTPTVLYFLGAGIPLAYFLTR